MYARPVLPPPRLGVVVAAATLSFLAAIGLFASVAGLFLGDGMPFEQVVVAERACAEAAFVSEREACIRSFIAATHERRVASR